MNNQKKVLTVISGARPQFIKISPVLHLLEKNNIPYRHIHSGQHYDYSMSKVFFEELGIKEPDINLGVGSHSHAIQTAKIMEKLDSILSKDNTKAVFIPGDTNTTIAGALTACKKDIPVIHHEAGLRSYDKTMPEEINRIVTDHCSEILLAPTSTAKKILLGEGIKESNIFVTGDTMLDVFIENLPSIKAKKEDITQKLNLSENYAVLTLHRQENTSNLSKFTKILMGLVKLSKLIPIIFPIHPRTKKVLDKENLNLLLDDADIKLIDPLGYIEFMALIEGSGLVITDSGGLQKESAFSGKPCLTLRDTTEWIETIENNWNRLIPTDLEKLPEIYTEYVSKTKINKNDVWHYYGDGKASKNILKVISSVYFG